MIGEATSSGGGGKDDSPAAVSGKKNKKPNYSRFTQQELPACKPILTPGWVITSFIVVGVVFIPIGLASLYASEHVVEIVERYDKDCIPPDYRNNSLHYIQTSETDKNCTMTINVPKHMKSPVFIYYELDNFYQNHRRLAHGMHKEFPFKSHLCCLWILKVEFSSVVDMIELTQFGARNLLFGKSPQKISLDKSENPEFVFIRMTTKVEKSARYVKSRSDKQLRSKASEGTTETCKPEAVTSNGQPIVPCGLVAWSLFNDTYKFSVKKEVLGVSKKNIAWKSDQEHKFGSDIYPKNFQNGSLIGGGKLNPSIPLSEQVDLIVWMRTAALPNFRKLYGKIEKDLQANTTITVTIENNYNTYSFGGKKKLVLSTTSWIGGKNSFLGRAYIAIGGLCLFLAVCFVFVYLLKPRPLGDPSYLSWNRNPSGQMN
ncbi:hypothetical protein DKX38_027448 [Salix brachista]|uniref:ALA-interacting subunit n=1 Tax=Salix brachista TaxID=2182728 RepID=A0A5N5JG35_9ROSI|nr:hypothetical protein DKX38_027448 [Salix brachista]